MYAVPWPLRPATVACLDAPNAVDQPRVDDLDVDLERVKMDVGVFRARKGDAAWKENVAAVDRQIAFQRVVERPVSRAYFKLVEILRTCAIPAPTTSLHLCEAPGGFAQAVASEYPATTRIMMTSRRTQGAPLFSSHLLQHERIEELDLAHTDLLRRDVRDEIVARVKEVDLITADGAIDNETRPEFAEDHSAWLLACEIETALRVQKRGGTFVVKIFGFMRSATRQLVALLTASYAEVSIIKPYTSRSVNDERYIICRGFIQCPPLPPLPDAPVGVLVDIASVDEAWLADARDIAHRMSRTQRQAIEQAIHLKSTSSGGKWQRPPRTGRGRPGQNRGRGRASDRASSSRGSRPNHTS